MVIRAAFLAFVVSVSMGARADTSYPISGSVDGFGGNGQLIVQSEVGSGNGDLIIGVNGPGVDGIIEPGGFHGNQNRFYPSGKPLLDSNGFSFTDTMDDTDFQVNIFGNTDGSYGAYIVDSDGVTISGAATFSISGAPMATNAALHEAMVRDAAVDGIKTYNFSFSATPAVAATPEPGSFALMGTGLLGAAALVRRRARL